MSTSSPESSRPEIAPFSNITPDLKAIFPTVHPTIKLETLTKIGMIIDDLLEVKKIDEQFAKDKLHITESGYLNRESSVFDLCIWQKKSVLRDETDQVVNTCQTVGCAIGWHVEMRERRNAAYPNIFKPISLIIHNLNSVYHKNKGVEHQRALEENRPVDMTITKDAIDGYAHCLDGGYYKGEPILIEGMEAVSEYLGIAYKDDDPQLYNRPYIAKLLFSIDYYDSENPTIDEVIDRLKLYIADPEACILHALDQATTS